MRGHVKKKKYRKKRSVFFTNKPQATKASIKHNPLKLPQAEVTFEEGLPSTRLQIKGLGSLKTIASPTH
jgi:hypothetical protein